MVALSWMRTGGVVAAAGTGSDVPRQQVLVGRVHLDRVRRLAAVGEQGVPVERRAARGDPVAKGGVVGGLGLVGARRAGRPRTRGAGCG